MFLLKMIENFFLHAFELTVSVMDKFVIIT